MFNLLSYFSITEQCKHMKSHLVTAAILQNCTHKHHPQPTAPCIFHPLTEFNWGFGDGLRWTTTWGSLLSSPSRSGRSLAPPRRGSGRRSGGRGGEVGTQALAPSSTSHLVYGGTCTPTSGCGGQTTLARRRRSGGGGGVSGTGPSSARRTRRLEERESERLH